LHLKNRTKAMSRLLVILLMLACLIIGALVSYMWVMASYFNMPQNVTTLVVENVAFSSDDFTNFNVTVLNPSNSAFGVSIGSFKVVIESQNETFNVTLTVPSLPFNMSVGTRQTFKCLKNWSNFAGESLRIVPVAENVSIQSQEYTPPAARMIIYGFDTSKNINHFNLTLENNGSIDLNVTEFLVNDFPANFAPSPFLLAINQSQVFTVDYGWGQAMGTNITVLTRTDAGFEQTYVTNAIPGAFAYVDEVKFDYTDTSYLNVTVKSVPESTRDMSLNNLTLTLSNQTTIVPSTFPVLYALPAPLPANQTLTIKCLWNWNNYRNDSLTVQVLSKEGFTVQNKTVTTPPNIVWSVDDVEFDLNDLQQFTVNVTNLAASTQEINVTEVDFNGNSTSLNSTTIAAGSQNTLTCIFNWTSFVGDIVNITTHSIYGTNEIVISQSIRIPYLKIVNASFSTFPTGTPHVNITLRNSEFSKTNTTIIQISISNGSSTMPLDGTISIPKIGTTASQIIIGTETTFVCPWDWSPYANQEVTIIVNTSDGLQVSTTLIVA